MIKRSGSSEKKKQVDFLSRQDAQQLIELQLNGFLSQFLERNQHDLQQVKNSIKKSQKLQIDAVANVIRRQNNVIELLSENYQSKFRSQEDQFLTLKGQLESQIDLMVESYKEEMTKRSVLNESVRLSQGSSGLKQIQSQQKERGGGGGVSLSGSSVQNNSGFQNSGQQLQFYEGRFQQLEKIILQLNDQNQGLNEQVQLQKIQSGEMQNNLYRDLETFADRYDAQIQQVVRKCEELEKKFQSQDYLHEKINLSCVTIEEVNKNWRTRSKQIDYVVDIIETKKEHILGLGEGKGLEENLAEFMQKVNQQVIGQEKVIQSVLKEKQSSNQLVQQLAREIEQTIEREEQRAKKNQIFEEGFKNLQERFAEYSEIVIQDNNQIQQIKENLDEILLSQQESQEEKQKQNQKQKQEYLALEQIQNQIKEIKQSIEKEQNQQKDQNQEKFKEESEIRKKEVQILQEELQILQQEVQILQKEQDQKGQEKEEKLERLCTDIQGEWSQQKEKLKAVERGLQENERKWQVKVQDLIQENEEMEQRVRGEVNELEGKVKESSLEKCQEIFRQLEEDLQKVLQNQNQSIEQVEEWENRLQDMERLLGMKIDSVDIRLKPFEQILINLRENYQKSEEVVKKQVEQQINLEDQVQKLKGEIRKSQEKNTEIEKDLERKIQQIKEETKKFIEDEKIQKQEIQIKENQSNENQEKSLETKMKIESLENELQKIKMEIKKILEIEESVKTKESEKLENELEKIKIFCVQICSEQVQKISGQQGLFESEVRQNLEGFNEELQENFNEKINQQFQTTLDYVHKVFETMEKNQNLNIVNEIENYASRFEKQIQEIHEIIQNNIQNNKINLQNLSQQGIIGIQDFLSFNQGSETNSLIVNRNNMENSDLVESKNNISEDRIKPLNNLKMEKNNLENQMENSENFEQSQKIEQQIQNLMKNESAVSNFTNEDSESLSQSQNFEQNETNNQTEQKKKKRKKNKKNKNKDEQKSNQKNENIQNEIIP